MISQLRSALHWSRLQPRPARSRTRPALVGGAPATTFFAAAGDAPFQCSAAACEIDGWRRERCYELFIESFIVHCSATENVCESCLRPQDFNVADISVDRCSGELTFRPERARVQFQFRHVVHFDISLLYVSTHACTDSRHTFRYSTTSTHTPFYHSTHRTIRRARVPFDALVYISTPSAVLRFLSRIHFDHNARASLRRRRRLPHRRSRPSISRRVITAAAA